MPYKERDLWRGQVIVGGKKYRRDFKRKEDAKAWEVKTREEMRKAEETPTQIGMDFLTFSNQYLDYAELHYVSRTYKNKKRVCKRLKAFIGNPEILVEEITSEMINAYLSAQAATGSSSRYNEDRKHLSAMWQWGIDILDIKSNPVVKVRRLPHTRAPQYTQPTKDILKLLAVCKREERIFMNCYLHTGARRSEIFQWTWNDDVNFEKRQVRLGTRKTRDGSMEYEWVPMNEELYRELWSWWENRPVKESPYVFVSTSNRYYGQRFTTRRQFMKGLCKRAGVKEFGFHALRRYVASVLADTHKLSSKVVQRVLRHKNVTTTERYIHNLNSDMAAVMELLVEKNPQTEPPKCDDEIKNASN